MANEIQTARGKIKTKLDIASSVTTFDDIINDCIAQAVHRLKPFVQYRIAPNTSVTMTSGDDSFTMPVSGSQLDSLGMRINTTSSFRDIDLWKQYRDTVYVQEPITATTYLRINATRGFTYSDADLALLEADYPSAMLPLYLFAMAEFATYMIGNKRKFNVYQQMNGVRTLSEMQELCEHYENRAIRILEDEISAEGQ